MPVMLIEDRCQQTYLVIYTVISRYKRIEKLRFGQRQIEAFSRFSIKNANQKTLPIYTIQC